MDSEFQYVMLTLKGSILYESGEADIKEIAEPILSKVGEILKKFDKYGVEITGHTDNVPMTSSTFKDNNWLSSARALNAAEFLIQNSDINPDRLKYSGRGEYEPVSSNATSEGRANNRRIEIKIHNEYSGW
jgi:chemotaxis protein MotB